MTVQQNNVQNFNVHDNTFNLNSNEPDALVGHDRVNATGSGRRRRSTRSFGIGSRRPRLAHRN
jgi:hypothetical protein